MSSLKFKNLYYRPKKEEKMINRILWPLLAALSIPVFGLENVNYFHHNQKRESNAYAGHLGVRANSIIDDVGDVPGNQHSFEFDFKYRNKGSRSFSKFEFTSMINNENDFMFSVPEAYYARRRNNNRFYFGRSILKWSPIDKFWGLGKINNRIGFDQFYPGQEGLTGFKYRYGKKKGVYLSSFGSLLYIPELNPRLQIDKNKEEINCRNPWCKAPTKNTILRGQEVPIRYNVNMPSADEVLFKPSIGTSLGYKNDFVDISIFGIRKPENTISTEAELSFEQELDPNEDDSVLVEIDPVIFYHDVVGGTLAFKGSGTFKGLQLYGSVMGVYPNSNPEGERIVYEYTGIRSEKRKEEYAGGGLSYNYRRVNAGIHYVARVSEFDHEEDDLLVEFPRWNQTIGLSAEISLFDNFLTSFDYKYDMITDDRITSFGLKKQFGRDLLLMGGVNMIGAPDDNSYWADYRNNDAVYMSAKILF